MRIDPKEIICGVSATKLRDFLRLMRKPWSVGDLSEHLRLSTEQARSVMERLEREEYALKTSTDSNGTARFENTLRGNELGNASAAQPVKRETADRAVAAFMERVRQVNADDYYLYRVTKVLVFGSYLSDKQRINDVDLALEAIRKHDRPAQMEMEKKRTGEAMSGGKRFPNITMQICWPYEEVMKFLKGRSRALSLHEIDDGILDLVETRVLFEDK